MLQELSNLVVADNTGAKRAMCFRILKQRKEYAHLGDVIRVAIKLLAYHLHRLRQNAPCTANTDFFSEHARPRRYAESNNLKLATLSDPDGTHLLSSLTSKCCCLLFR